MASSSPPTTSKVTSLKAGGPSSEYRFSRPETRIAAGAGASACSRCIGSAGRFTDCSVVPREGPALGDEEQLI